MLRGQRGSPVRVTVMREGATEPVTVTVIRGEAMFDFVEAIADRFDVRRILRAGDF